MSAQRSKSGAGLITVEALGLLAHDLRAPLAALTVWCDVLATATDDGLRAQALRSILASVRAQEQAIDELVDVARLAGGGAQLERREVELRHVARRAIARARPLGDERRVRLALAIDRHGDARGAAKQLHVDGDAERLAQLFAHLLRRAIKSASSGATVTLSFAVAPPSGPARGRARSVRAAVSIDGRAAGAAPARRGSDFDVFVANHLAKQHDARLTFGEEPTVFVVELPLTTRPQVRAARTRRRTR